MESTKWGFLGFPLGFRRAQSLFVVFVKQVHWTCLVGFSLFVVFPHLVYLLFCYNKFIGHV